MVRGIQPSRDLSLVFVENTLRPWPRKLIAERDSSNKARFRLSKFETISWNNCRYLQVSASEIGYSHLIEVHHPATRTGKGFDVSLISSTYQIMYVGCTQRRDTKGFH